MLPLHPLLKRLILLVPLVILICAGGCAMRPRHATLAEFHPGGAYIRQYKVSGTIFHDTVNVEYALMKDGKDTRANVADIGEHLYFRVPPDTKMLGLMIHFKGWNFRSIVQTLPVKLEEGKEYIFERIDKDGCTLLCLREKDSGKRVSPLIIRRM